MDDATFHVSVTREDGYWVAVVDGVPGGATEVRRLSTLDTEVRDLLSGLLDVDEDALRLDYDYSEALGAGAHKWVSEYWSTRAQMAKVRHEYEHAQECAVLELREAGVSLRDAAELLDVSFQRVQQLGKG